MAMSRILSQSSLLPHLRPPSAALISHHRHRSNKPAAALIELDLVDQSSPSDSSPEPIAVGIRRLEEAIHSIIVRRAAPDWLPFLPGSSYWVPPRARGTQAAAGNMIEVIGKLKLSSSGLTRNAGVLSEDEERSLSSAKGWPSSEFFIEGTSPMHPIPVMQMGMKTQDNEGNVDDKSISTDEDG